MAKEIWVRESVLSEKKMIQLVKGLFPHRDMSIGISQVKIDRKKKDVILYLTILKREFTVYVHFAGRGGKNTNNSRAKHIDIRITMDMSLLYLKETLIKEISYRHAGYLHEDRTLAFLESMREQGMIQQVAESSDIEDLYGFDAIIKYNDVSIPVDITKNKEQKKIIKKTREESTTNHKTDHRKKSEFVSRINGEFLKRIPILCLNFSDSPSKLRNEVLEVCKEFVKNEVHPEEFLEKVLREIEENEKII